MVADRIAEHDGNMKIIRHVAPLAAIARVIIGPRGLYPSILSETSTSARQAGAGFARVNG